MEREQRIGGGVGLVEAVAGELGHEVENLFDLLGREAALVGAADEAVALGGHLIGLLLPMARRSRSASPRE